MANRGEGEDTESDEEEKKTDHDDFDDDERKKREKGRRRVTSFWKKDTVATVTGPSNPSRGFSPPNSPKGGPQPSPNRSFKRAASTLLLKNTPKKHRERRDFGDPLPVTPPLGFFSSLSLPPFLLFCFFLSYPFLFDSKPHLWGMGRTTTPHVKEVVPLELVAIKGNTQQRELQLQLLCSSLLNNEKTCRVLRLRGSMLDRKELEKLRWAIANNECMAQLDLSFSALRYFDTDFSLIAHALGKHPSLALLDLTCSGAGAKGTKACEEVVRSNLNIVEVLGLGVDPSDALLPSLGEDERETRLSLGPQGFAALAQSPNQAMTPRKQSPKGHSLRHSNTFIRPKDATVKKSALSSFINENLSLRDFRAFSGDPSILPYPCLTVSLTNRDLPGFPTVLFHRNLLYLRSLNLSKNGLESLPPVIGAMECLETLLLHRNKLKKLPATIGDLKQLKTLDISSNQLTSLPPTFRLLCESIEVLDLSANFFSELPYYLRRFPRLEKFYVKNNPLRLKGTERDGNSAEALRQIDGGEFCYPKRSKIVLFGSGVDLEVIRSLFKDSSTAPVPLFKRKPSILGEPSFRKRPTLASSNLSAFSKDFPSEGPLSQRFVSPPPGIGSSPAPSFSSSTPASFVFSSNPPLSKDPLPPFLDFQSGESSKNFSAESSEKKEGENDTGENGEKRGEEEKEEKEEREYPSTILSSPASSYATPLSLSPAFPSHCSSSRGLPPSSLFSESLPQPLPTSPGLSSRSSPFPIVSSTKEDSSSSLSSVPSSPLPTPQQSPSISPSLSPSPSPSLSPKKKTFLSFDPSDIVLVPPPSSPSPDSIFAPPSPSNSSYSSSSPSNSSNSFSLNSPSSPNPSSNFLSPFSCSFSSPPPSHSLSLSPSLQTMPSSKQPEVLREIKSEKNPSFRPSLPPFPASLLQCPDTPPPVPLHESGSSRDSSGDLKEKGKEKDIDEEESKGKGEEREENHRGRSYTDSPLQKRSLHSDSSSLTSTPPPHHKLQDSSHQLQPNACLRNISPHSFRKTIKLQNGTLSPTHCASPFPLNGTPSNSSSPYSSFSSSSCSPLSSSAFIPSTLSRELQVSEPISGRHPPLGAKAGGKKDLNIFVDQFQVGRKRDRQTLTVTALGITGEGKEVVRCAPMIVSDYSMCVVFVRLSVNEEFSFPLETEKLIFMLGERFQVLVVLLGEDDHTLGLASVKAQESLDRDSKAVCAVLSMNLITSMLLLYFILFYFLFYFLFCFVLFCFVFGHKNLQILTITTKGKGMEDLQSAIVDGVTSVQKGEWPKKTPLSFLHLEEEIQFLRFASIIPFFPFFLLPFLP